MKTSVKSNYSPPIMGRGKGVGLLFHYLKIALRNMRRFRLQTIVCLTGLAVGMTCFALGTLWLRFIESFENFVPDADNIYLVMGGKGKNLFASGFYYYTQTGEGETIAKNKPGVEEYSHIVFAPSAPNENIYKLTVDGRTTEAFAAFADSAYTRMFGIEAEEGSLTHLRNGEMALTRSAAQRLFGGKSALGRNVGMVIPMMGSEPVEQTFTVVAIIADRPQNSQFRYEVLANSEAIETPPTNGYLISTNACTFVKFAPTVPTDSIVGTHELELTTSDDGKFKRSYTFVPLTQLRTEFPCSEVKIATSYVRWFMSLGLLVILCSLANYLITMVSHLRRRGWEMSLRRVLGSSRAHILYMVCIETLLIFLLATVLACALTALVLPYFRQYSGIAIAWNDIATRLAAYLALVIVVGMALSSLTAWTVMRRIAPQPPKGGVYNPDRNSPFRGLGGLLQMSLSMAIIFCAVVMLRQVRMLMYSDELGFTHADMGAVYTIPEELKAKIQHSSLCAESHPCDKAMFPRRSYSESALSVDEKTREDYQTYIRYNSVGIHKDMFDCYRMSLVCGELPVFEKYKSLYREEYVDAEYNGATVKVLEQHWITEIAISEAMCKRIGWTPEQAVGKSLWNTLNEYRISGVMKDTYLLGPTVEPDAALYFPVETWGGPDLMFRAQPGRTAELCDSIRQWVAALDEEEASRIDVINCEAEFDKYIASEMMLIRILSAVGLASLFVCVIGTFSLVSLSLQQRRKEIAIRKVHGARMKDILRLFLKGQVVSLLIAAIVAYPIAYVIMRHWLEGYQKQVAIDWWLIPATFAAIAAVVLATIALKVWRAAKESTVEALNS